MLTGIAFLLSSPEQHLCCFRGGEFYIEPVAIAENLRRGNEPQSTEP
jgi:hypothetical protein